MLPVELEGGWHLGKCRAFGIFGDIPFALSAVTSTVRYRFQTTQNKTLVCTNNTILQVHFYNLVAKFCDKIFLLKRSSSYLCL